MPTLTLEAQRWHQHHVAGRKELTLKLRAILFVHNLSEEELERLQESMDRADEARAQLKAMGIKFQL